MLGAAGDTGGLGQPLPSAQPPAGLQGLFPSLISLLSKCTLSFLLLMFWFALGPFSGEAEL